MKFKTLKSDITNPTIHYLADWLEVLAKEFKNENVLANVDELATQLEAWRIEFINDQKELACHWGDQVTVATYGGEVILISDQRSGEFIKLFDFEFTAEPKPSRKRPLVILLILTALMIVLGMQSAQSKAILPEPCTIAASYDRGDFLGIFGPRTGAQYAAKQNRGVVRQGKKTIRANRKHTRKGGRR